MTTLETGPNRHKSATTALSAGWYDDPEEKHRLRYHDGYVWTDHVTHYGPTPCLRCHQLDG